MKNIVFFIFFAIYWRFSIPLDSIGFSVEQSTKDCTALARDDITLLVFSTLGGGLIAIDSITSEIKWSIEDEPAIKAERESHSPLPRILPNPKDGSLYQLDMLGNLKKLPFTVPQLVANAPCRSSDGILYSGKKSDSWYLVDPKTGDREKVMGFSHKDEDIEKLEYGKIGCTTSCSVYLGRTQYTVMMLDSLSKNKNLKPWNITFYDYLSHVMAPESSSDYGYIHLTASSSGVVATLNKQGSLLWKKDLGSPIISAYLLGKEGLLSVPFTTVADNVLESIVQDARDDTINEIKLSQSIYIGEHSHGFYALPSLVDEDTARLTSVTNIKLLEGPDKKDDRVKPNSIYITDYSILGHYDIHSKVTVDDSVHNSKEVSSNFQQIEFNKDFVKAAENSCFYFNHSNNALSNSSHITKFLYDAKAWLPYSRNDNVYQLLLIVILLSITLMWYAGCSSRQVYFTYLSGSQSSSFRKSSKHPFSYKALEELGDGQVRVGKIIFDPEKILGKGCEGTFVFRGTFEKRNVAVKRLLPECFTFADREVALLRESDTHENVIRYFCTEQDRQFRYIALELCAATLQDISEGSRCHELCSVIDLWDILKQATSGLSHLHSLNIVHRDIKPQNVLLSFPDSNNMVRAMISDFGLCKKLNHDSKSFSRRSGITGTEGWIAPEMILGKRTTTAVDIFSLGCVFYYVLTRGYHLFGDTLKRQANILANEYNLCELQNKNCENLEKSKLILAEQLIEDMIQHESEKRPDAEAVHAHPLFWSEEKILIFLQDVSDRVEKLTVDVEPLCYLEKNGCMIVNNDWSLYLEPEIINDLRKYRGYIGVSVRDLLRALRNKKHHYHELSPEAQQMLGSLPKEFTKYWISKFPYLLQHAYHALSFCSNENLFRCYYNHKFSFSKPSYFNQKTDNDFFLLASNNKFYSNAICPTRGLNRNNKRNFAKKYKNGQKNSKINQNAIKSNIDTCEESKNIENIQN
ncbi:serine/threonine-protein kinase/endoribonuclease IRE1 [Condylostylus longicornis]|uniref:serine/threonine-protein kinase/endoribonuclease IRE1 n=1 Tax=Condylostylus longicornis TaxID=2530218 RepID=UPI00244DAE19|nr:serine/threonine-protein kinase/endoribonuclease IRE1 [Condylostylus longicornis]